MNVLIALPVYNEEKILEQTIEKSIEHIRRWSQYSAVPVRWQIVIADNHSTDRTPQISQRLVERFNEVAYTNTGVVGKGAAIRQAWQTFDADACGFMDADLSTDLEALPALVNGLVEGYDVVIGSRAHPQSKIRRSWWRRFFSFGYRWLLRVICATDLNDAPCGFKIISRAVRDSVLPLVQDNQWFFDSELVIMAQRRGYRVKEIPVVWQDLREKNDHSKVRVFSLSWAYVRKAVALRRRLNISIK